MREVTRQFQEVYSAAKMLEQNKVHMMPYPILVHEDGTVESEPGWEMFPDTEGLVCVWAEEWGPARKFNHLDYV